MDSAMIGVGVGFDTKGGKNFKAYKPSTKSENHKHYVISDTREGWVQSV